MADKRQADDAFLADLTAFLGEEQPSTMSGTELHVHTTTEDDSLLVASELLFSETERLLSTLKEKQNAKNNAIKTSKTSPRKNIDEKLSTKNLSGDKKREIKNLQAADRRNRYRQKLKDEKQSLIQQESELSTQLNKLQAAEAEKQVHSVKTMTLSVWRAIAKRQMEKRVEAEQQQRQLRAAVVNRARLVHQMKTLLQEPMLDASEDMSLFRENESSLEGDAVLKNYLRELDALYAQADEIFRGLDFKVSTSMEYNPTKKIEQGVEYFESTASVVIPYAYEQASEAISSIMMSDMGARRYDEDVKDPHNTIAVRYDIDFRGELGDSTTLVVSTAARRYKEASRVVFVWRALTEGQDEFNGFHADETGWNVVRPFGEGGPTSRDSPQTIMESYVRVVPTSLSGVSSNQVRANRFAKILEKSGAEEVKEMTQMMESMLLGSPSMNHYLVE